jgi:hypothetical protein
MDRTSKKAQWRRTDAVDDFCSGHCSGVFITINREESAQFALGQIVALAIAPFVLALIVILTSPVRAGHQATSPLPSVAGGKAESIMGGVERNLARPGGNLTETVLLSPELTLKRFELIKQAVPGITRVAVLWEPDAYDEGNMKAILKDAWESCVSHRAKPAIRADR